jgi:hypothetical protein
MALRPKRFAVSAIRLVAMLHREFGEHHYGRVDLTLRDGQKEKPIERFNDSRFWSLLKRPLVGREDLHGVKVFSDDGPCFRN